MISFLPEERENGVIFTAYDGDTVLGKCKFVLDGNSMTFTAVECTDDIITEGLARSAMGYAASRNGYTAKINKKLSSAAFERLGFTGSEELSAEIPEALTCGCTCHREKTEM